MLRHEDVLVVHSLMSYRLEAHRIQPGAYNLCTLEGYQARTWMPLVFDKALLSHKEEDLRTVLVDIVMSPGVSFKLPLNDYMQELDFKDPVLYQNTVVARCMDDGKGPHSFNRYIVKPELIEDLIGGQEMWAPMYFRHDPSRWANRTKSARKTIATTTE